jgi:hypothetical protein
MEEFLARALRNHPDILAAEAKLESAQAELTRTRFVITRELITLWNERNAQLESVQHLEWIRKSSGSTAVLRELIEAKGKASEIDAQVSYLLGQMGGAAARAPAAAGTARSKRLPQGPQVEKVLAELNSPTELQFIETPIWDVVEFVMDLHDFQFVRDPLLPDVSVTMDMKGIPLGAALQAVEDTTPGVRFVVCDYGILVTSDESDAAAAYISANEFWREQLPQEGTGEGAPSAVKARVGSTSALFAPRKPDPHQGVSAADPFD